MTCHGDGRIPQHPSLTGLPEIIKNPPHTAAPASKMTSG
jgi:hypothetical protein